MYHIAAKKKTFADPFLTGWITGPLYKTLHYLAETDGMNWKTYALSLLMANAVMIFVGYMVLRLAWCMF